MAYEMIQGASVQQTLPSREILHACIFLAAIAFIYVCAGTLVARRLGSKVKGRKSVAERIIYALAIFGIACMLYGYFVEPYWPQVRHVTLKTAKWTAPQPLRVVLLSDMHSDPHVRLEERLPGLVADLKPMVILFAGDCVNSPAGFGNFRSCVTKLAAVAPTFAVQGNWDCFIWPGLKRFDGTGVHVLAAESAPLSVLGQTLYIVGVAADRQQDADQAFSAVPANALTFFLHHYPYPDILSAAHRAQTDLFAAGHVHGGQVALPFYGAILTLSRFGKQYESGLYHVGTMPLYVSRGIGMEGGPVPRVRFWSRPEITVIDFVAETGSR